MKTMTLMIEAKPFGVLDPAPMERLRAAAFHILDFRGSGITEPGFIEAFKQAHVLLCGNDLRVDDGLLARAPALKAISKMGVGLDTIDLDAATRRGVIVFNTPGVNNQAVADHTFAMMLAVARKIVHCDRSLREKRWEHTKIMGLEIWQKTLGLIGLGAIGQCVALRAKGFDMTVVAHDPYWPDSFAKQHGIGKMAVDDLLAVSDVVSLHVPLLPETRNLIDRGALAKMKPTAILVNASRGGVVNEADLCRALKDGVIAGAGIDVFAVEPPNDSPLVDLDNTVLTPHTAAFTHDALNNMNTGCVDQLIAYLGGEMPRYTVNPEASAD
jgi:D-3-phosphoglycerate dehydrogenase